MTPARSSGLSPRCEQRPSRVPLRKKNTPIDLAEFTQLCISGPFRHMELKPSWWTKLGKKKGKKDDASSAAPSSAALSTGDPDDMAEGACGAELPCGSEGWGGGGGGGASDGCRVVLWGEGGGGRGNLITDDPSVYLYLMWARPTRS